MSVVEMLIAMYGAVDVAKVKNGAPDRSRVLVSKGHCAAAVYGTMHHFGLLPAEMIDTYFMDGSALAGHVSHVVPGVEHSTGALGHGINVAVGCAIGLRNLGAKDSLSLALMGDGELQEGSVWEAIMLASHLKLDNFIGLVDNNRISSITSTHEVIDLRPIDRRFSAFGFAVETVDGHSVAEISHAIARLRGRGCPGMIICETIKGKDVAFAENEAIWHYKTMTDQQYEEARNRLSAKIEVAL
jgi:transketolase